MNAAMPDGRLGLLTATPDLVAAGLMPALVERLAIDGLRPLAALPHVYSPAETFMMYNGKPTHPRSDRARIHSNWLAPRLFTGGVSLVIVLRADTAHKDGTQARLCAIKGSSRRGQASAAQLRSLSPSCDRSLSLVHCPDDDTSVMHELRLLFGSALARWINGPCALDRPLLPPEWLPALVPAAAAESAAGSMLAAWPVLLRRATCVLAADPLGGVDLALATDMAAALQDLGKALDAMGTAGGPEDLWCGLAALRPFATVLHRQSADAMAEAGADGTGYARAAARATLSRVVLAACEADAVDPVLSGLLARAFSAAGTPLSHWEEQRLHVIAAYHAA